MNHRPATFHSRRCNASPSPSRLALTISALLLGGALSGDAAAQAFPPTFNLGSLNGSNGFRLDGAAEFDNSGFSVSSAGDVNGDGLDDLILGAPYADPNGNYSGSSYVVFGRRTPFPAALSLASLDGKNGFRIDGSATFDNSGWSVSSAGDINGDGFDDLVVGAFRASLDIGRPGSAYVVFGKSTRFAAVIALSGLTGANGFRVDGASEYDVTAASATTVGDINGDGLDDLIVGASGVNVNGVNQAGRSYVVFGKRSPFAATSALASLDGTDGFRLDGVADGDLSGNWVSGAGDINGDGIADLIVGALRADPNGDNSGSSYVVFGKHTPFAATLPLSSLNGTNGFRLDGVAADDRSGYSASGAGDINGDGIDDLIIGAPRSDSNGDESGSSYVVFGKRVPFAATLPLSSLDGANGFRIEGAAAGDHSGRAVSSAGDINGDGLDDLIVGAWLADSNGTYSGSSYVVFGRSESFSPVLLLSDLNGTNGFRLDGEATGDESGLSVSAAGDVNGDGLDDLIIGAYFAGSKGLFHSGRSYVVFGRETLFENGFE